MCLLQLIFWTDESGDGFLDFSVSVRLKPDLLGEGVMSDWLMRVIKAEAKQLIALAADDDELRADLRALANEILAATEDAWC